MAKPRVLVTSAAGHTGTQVVRELLERGFPVRAFVRRKDSRSEAMRSLGAEIFVGDLFDFRDLRRSMADVQRAYHCAPFAPNLLQSNMLFAVAAEEAKLEMVALMEAWNAHHSHPTAFTRDHWASQKVLDWMPSVDVVHIAPGLFAFAYFLDVQTIRHLGLLLLPLGNGLNAPPSNEDIAAVVASVIASPDGHVGKFYRPTGPKLISPSDVAAACSRVLGRKVRYREVSTWMFTKAARALRLSAFEIANIRYFAEEHRAGLFGVAAPTDDVVNVTGRPPEDFDVTARRYLENPGLVNQRFSTGSKFGAIRMLLKTIVMPALSAQTSNRNSHQPLLQRSELAHESSDWHDGLMRFDFAVPSERRSESKPKAVSPA